MSFRRYEHIERLGHVETSGLTDGTVYVFPKLDGTNASVWRDPDTGHICSGSRNRQLSADQDNAGFHAWVSEQGWLFSWLQTDWTVYGEWLVPHTIKRYREDAWRKFYVFDVWDRKAEKFIPYLDYAPRIVSLSLEVVSPLALITNPTDSDLLRILNTNTYLMEDGAGAGEGIVLKNYEWMNSFGRQVWAKIVRNEFKEKNLDEFGLGVSAGSREVEREIAEKYVTEALVLKTLAKIEQDTTEKRIVIPRLLQTVFYELLREEAWSFVKEHKFPTIDFKKLQRYSSAVTKARAPSLFGRELVA